MATNTKPRTELSVYMNKPEVMTRFQEIFPNLQLAKSYINSVLILVASDENLQDCTPKSIFISSLRAAALGLSCDKSMKQAWLVPYDVTVKAHKVVRDGQEITIPEHKEKQAQFQPHYLGLYNLAMRTGKYRVIHVTPIYEGTRVLENVLTGLHYVEEGGLISMPANPNAIYRDVTSRRKKDLKVIGWLAYFMTMKGAEKSEYMSVVEIDDHARRYVKGYLDDKGNVKNPNWKDHEKRAVMEMKTVFKKLTNWMDLSGEESRKLAEALKESDPAEIVDAPAEDVPAEAPASVVGQMTYEQAQGMTINSPLGVVSLSVLSLDTLNEAYWQETTTDNEREAIQLILKEEYQMDAPEKPARSQEQNMKELGF